MRRSTAFVRGSTKIRQLSVCRPCTTVSITSGSCSDTRSSMCFEEKNSCMKVIVTALEERSEEHTSELQSLMRISYAVFCLNKKKITKKKHNKQNMRQKIQ